MLPAGLTADPLSRAEQQLLCNRHPGARVAMRLVHGACSCDLVRERGPTPREDEAPLRRRYFQRGVPRERVIRALEAHRVGGRLPAAQPGHWPGAAKAFAAEHARNAGPALYYLRFSDTGPIAELPAADPPLELSAANLGGVLATWLPEERLIVLSR